MVFDWLRPLQDCVLDGLVVPTDGGSTHPLNAVFNKQIRLFDRFSWWSSGVDLLCVPFPNLFAGNRLRIVNKR